MISCVGMEVLIEDRMRLSHEIKNDDEQNAVQIELMQRKATEYVPDVRGMVRGRERERERPQRGVQHCMSRPW